MCSDLNSGLIDLWHEIINHPDLVSTYYEKLWYELNIDDNKQRKKEYFSKIRERYNNEHNPLDFMFIMRTTTNGMPRYNHDGEFNNSFHVTRNGIIPESSKKVEFISCGYDEINPKTNDFVYLDPPYANTKGMYYGAIDYSKLWNWMRDLPCKYLLSFDGISGQDDNTFDVPKRTRVLCGGIIRCIRNC